MRNKHCRALCADAIANISDFADGACAVQGARVTGTLLARFLAERLQDRRSYLIRILPSQKAVRESHKYRGLDVSFAFCAHINTATGTASSAEDSFDSLTALTNHMLRPVAAYLMMRPVF
jgi:hypothetical protein